eukprot:gene8578-8760_t
MSDQLRELLTDAVSVYKTEAVVPDGVTDVLITAYRQLHNEQQQTAFFTLLARDFGVQRRAVDAAVQLWQEKVQPAAAGRLPHDETIYRLAEKLTAAAQPLYMQVLLPVSQHPAGIAFLVQLRSDLLHLLKQQPAMQQGYALRALSQDLRSALARWFSVGLLQLQRITWEESSGQLLESVMLTEAVHRMQHLQELKRRLQQSDRRVFAFLHPSLPGQPLVVLHTAIMDTIPDSMAGVLAQSQQNLQQPAEGAATASVGPGSTGQKRRRFALDPVAHFHLKNGAWLWRINCRADLSAAGLDRSCGLMSACSSVSSRCLVPPIEFEVSAEEQQELESKAPADLLCPLGRVLMTDPVFTPSGFTYHRPCVLELLSLTGRDPVGGFPLCPDQLCSNINLRDQVARWLQDNGVLA